jgi:hypothetical protein
MSSIEAYLLRPTSAVAHFIVLIQWMDFMATLCQLRADGTPMHCK